MMHSTDSSGNLQDHHSSSKSSSSYASMATKSSATTYNRRDPHTHNPMVILQQRQRVLDLFEEEENKSESKIHVQSPAALKFQASLMRQIHHNKCQEHANALLGVPTSSSNDSSSPHPTFLSIPPLSRTSTATSASSTITSSSGTCRNDNVRLMDRLRQRPLLFLGMLLIFARSIHTKPNYYLDARNWLRRSSSVRRMSVESAGEGFASQKAQHGKTAATSSHVAQIVAASPEVGYLDVIGMAHSIPTCSMLHAINIGKAHPTTHQDQVYNYARQDLVLSLYNHPYAPDGGDVGGSSMVMVAKFEASSLTQTTEPSTTNITGEINPGGAGGQDVLVARFLIGRNHWKKIVLAAAPKATTKDSSSSSSTFTAITVDKYKGSQTEHLPIWVDPSLSQHHYYYDEYESSKVRKKMTKKKHIALHFQLTDLRRKATTKTSKLLEDIHRKLHKRIKQSKSGMTNAPHPVAPKAFLAVAAMIRESSSTQSTSGVEVCKDICLYLRLEQWLLHYRGLGIQHFYILDNAPFEEPIPEAFRSLQDRQGVTYIRTNNLPYTTSSNNHVADCPEHNSDMMQPGRTLMENAILKSANVDWLLLANLDELLVPQWQLHHDNSVTTNTTNTTTTTTSSNSEMEAPRDLAHWITQTLASDKSSKDIISLALTKRQVCAASQSRESVQQALSLATTTMNDTTLLSSRHQDLSTKDNRREKALLVRTSKVGTILNGLVHAFPTTATTSNDDEAIIMKTKGSMNKTLHLDPQQQAWMAKVEFAPHGKSFRCLPW